ncbi:MAG TPA: hypothetical protein VEV82_01080, partial [Actinomycetota bacterium]|nr:hypothetical protein [Actinomycetota bacterium]
DAVDSEEEEVFLTSQLVDQARGVVFAGRITTELGGDPAPNSKLEELFDLVEERADEVRVQREQNAALYEGMLLNNVIYEGVIVVSFLRHLDGYLDTAQILPGLRAGLTAVARDTTRHVLFGVRLLQEAVDRDQGSDAAAIESVIEMALPVVNGVINEAAALSADFSGLQFDDNGISEAAMETLARRMHDIGIDLPT